MSNVARRLADIPAGSWTKWLVVGFWVVVLVLAWCRPSWLRHVTACSYDPASPVSFASARSPVLATGDMTGDFTDSADSWPRHRYRGGQP